MRRILFVLIALLALVSVIAACTPSAPAPAAEAPAAEAPAAEAPAAEEPAAEATEEPAEEPTAIVDIPGKTTVRWFIGLGTGSNPEQQEAQQAVVAAFNEANPDLNLVMEVVQNESARDIFSTQLAAGDPPAIVGPIGWTGSNAFYGQWSDLTPLIEEAGYDTTQFSDELIEFMQTEEGQVGLPFAVFPAAIFYHKALFDEAGLNYPPSTYGDAYVWPDGTEEEWNFDTLTKISQILTVDVNGNSPVDYDDSGNVEPNPDFDPASAVQYGFTYNWSARPYYIGTYWGAASDIAEDGSAEIPENWKDAWHWWYDGQWGDEPFIPTGPVIAGADFQSGSGEWGSGRVAMALTQSWYTCCQDGIEDPNWDLAVLPLHDGAINGRIDADTFRIPKGTPLQSEAFRVLSYLVGEGSLPLLNVYGGLPSRAEDIEPFLANLAARYPNVENWDVFEQGLAFPDTPSAEAWRPDPNATMDRYNTFGSLLQSTGDLDVDAEIELLEADLNAIFERAADQ